MSEPVNFVVEHYDNEELAEANEQLAMMVAKLHIENDRLREQGERLLDKTLELGTENAKLRNELDLCLKCEDCEAMLDCDECLRADSSQKERKRLDYENDSLRELVEDMVAEIRGLGVDFKRIGWCDYADRMRELGVEV